MNQAVQNERLAVRQKLVECLSRTSRRGAGAPRSFTESNWPTNLEPNLKNFRPGAICQPYPRRLADAVMCSDNSGKQIYPTVAVAPIDKMVDTRWLEAQRVELNDPAQRPFVMRD